MRLFIVLLSFLLINCVSPTSNSINVINKVKVITSYWVSGNAPQSDCYIYENDILSHVIINTIKSSGLIHDSLLVISGSHLCAEFGNNTGRKYIYDTIATENLYWNIGSSNDYLP